MSPGCIDGHQPVQVQNRQHPPSAVTSRTDATGRARIEHLVTAGTFSLDGGTWEVENNVWIIGDDDQCLVIDPAHNPAAVVEAVGTRAVVAVLLTHGHDDHIRVVKDVADALRAPVYLHPADTILWDQVYSTTLYDRAISDRDTFTACGVRLTALHTPGHSPGSVCFWAPGLGEHGVVFSGDTLFQGGPGATGRSYSNFPTIIDSIRDQLLTLPGDTEVLTGHGDSTTIGAEAPHLQEWINRGH
ncbi:MBL fold metallo-hydrolase [Kocuria rosea]|uniref:MBL fold metallo-hydrolase n=1 Tax=Kocuria rosea TaxID=1275 RepID=A0A4R5YDP8_KOCRO|nr:MBL fold metallo-hydrolase [Kocuria rosea]TDL43022.1 MBL fold metallo-hydrolase [Kocuria rosea]